MPATQAQRVLDETDFMMAGWWLGVEPEVVEAVAVVEAGPWGAFLPSGEPVILFERHKFHKHTGGRFSASHPRISSPQRGGYGKVAEQHPKLKEATALDRQAALKSCSWGLFQILGENHQQAGFPTVQGLVNAMYRTASDHLKAFIIFVSNDMQLVSALRHKDFRSFSRRYNGPAFAENQHDIKMAAAYAEAVKRRRRVS